MSRHPYEGPVTRVRLIEVGTRTVGLLGLALVYLIGLGLLLPTGAVALIVVWSGLAAAMAAWQVLLGWANYRLMTATLMLTPDAVEIHMGEGVVHLPRESIRSGSAFAVLYRQGTPNTVPGPLIRPRRIPQQAAFIPVQPTVGRHPLLWALARMYAGRAARMGFIVTPDHADYEALLSALEVNPALVSRDPTPDSSQ